MLKAIQPFEELHEEWAELQDRLDEAAAQIRRGPRPQMPVSSRRRPPPTRRSQFAKKQVRLQRGGMCARRIKQIA